MGSKLENNKMVDTEYKIFFFLPLPNKTDPLWSCK